MLCVGKKKLRNGVKKKETVTPIGWLPEGHRKLRVTSGLLVWFQGSVPCLKFSSFMRCQYKITFCLSNSINVTNLTCLLHLIFNLWYFCGLKCVNIKF